MPHCNSHSLPEVTWGYSAGFDCIGDTEAMEDDEKAATVPDFRGLGNCG